MHVFEHVQSKLVPYDVKGTQGIAKRKEGDSPGTPELQFQIEVWQDSCVVFCQ
jgi:hypothetical protein